MHPVESKARFLLDLCHLPLEFPPDLPAFLLLSTSMFSPPRVLCCSNSLLEERECELSSAGYSLLAALMWYLWMCGLMDWWRNVMSNSWILPTCLCRDSSYGLTSFPSCQFLENTQEFSLSFQFLWSTWSKNLGGEKYTNTKKSNHKQQQTYYSNTEKCRKLLFCLFIWECLPFLRMLISKFI